MTSIVKRQAEIAGHFRGLPDTQQVASFNFIDQAVILRNFERSDIEKIAASNNFQDKWPRQKEVWLNAHHEYRHWLDMTSSVFGLEWLSQVAGAAALSQNGLQNPTDAFRALCQELTKRMATIHLPAYYSTIENPLPRPWRSSVTVGRAFATDGALNTQHPLWFVRFASLEHAPIARQPMSVASLLELRALTTEMVFGYGLIEGIPEEEQRIVERAELTRALIDRLYDPYLTVYSAAAHLFANSKDLSDFAAVGSAASDLAWFCLEAPTGWLTQIHATDVFTQQHGDFAGELMSRSLQRGDRGALYLMLASDERLRANSLIEDLNNLLSEEWHVTFGELAARSRDEKAVLLQSLRDSPNTAELSERWTQNVDQMAGGRSLHLAADGIQLPAAILADDTPFNVRKMSMGTEAFDETVFDPRPFFDWFMNVDIALSKFGLYTENGLHCFSDR
jgi:hypothetical protein